MLGSPTSTLRALGNTSHDGHDPAYPVEGHGRETGQEGENEVSNESAALPPQPDDVPFLVTVSELRDRKLEGERDTSRPATSRPSGITLPSQASAVVSFVTVSAAGVISAPVAQFIPPSGRSYNGCDLSITPDGSKLLLLTMNANNAFSAGSGLLFVGTVGGGNVVTWDSGTNITANVTGVFATLGVPTPSKILILANGDWLAFIYNSSDAAVIKCANCNAAAQVWSAQTTVKAGNASCTAWTEMDGVQFTSGTVYATLRCDSGPSAGLSSVVSGDNGGTWSAPISIYPGSNPGKGGALVRDPTNDHMVMLTRNPVGGAIARGTSVDGAGVTWSALTAINSASAYASGVYKSAATSNWLVGINGRPGDAGAIVQFQSYAIP
jgi:hypothetical protein